jgi:hypothetical protein
MKKLFTLIAVAAMALSAYAQNGAVTYTFNNKAETYVLGDNCEATTYTMDDKVGFSVNYLNGGNVKMQVKLAANPDVFFEYGNSSAKSNAVKTGENYFQCDSKNFIINIPVQTNDVIRIKYSAKGSNAAVVAADGSFASNLVVDEASVGTCSAKTEAEAVTYIAKATKGGTAKIKETGGGMRVYAISISQDSSADIEAVKTVKAAAQNGATYNVAGQQVDAAAKGLVIKDGKKFVNK